MTLDDYKEIIKKTAVYPEEIGFAYCTMGIVGEFGEFLEAYNARKDEEIIKEAGDVMWYLTALSTRELDEDINKLFAFELLDQEPGTLFIESVLALGRISENVKKFYRDGKPLDINMEIGYIADVIYTLCFVRSISIQYVLEKNYEKLVKRRETDTLHGDGNNREEA